MAGIGVSAGASTLKDAPGMLISQLATDGARTVVVLRGEADFSVVSVLSDALAGAMSSGADVVIDLAGLGFIDTASVRVLAAAQHRLGPRGRTLTFRSPNAVAARMLEMFGLTELIETDVGISP
jgi:anti-anti-sigma factor